MKISQEMSLLQQKKARMTKAREAIVTVILNGGGPVSANRILTSLEKEGLKVNKTTVYRELAFLTKNGILKEVYLEAGTVHYESALLPHHHHFICTNCDSIEEVDCVIDEIEIRKKAKRNGFTLQTHNLELYGVCANCV